MAKADGGASVPKFIADLGIEPLTQGFKFLGSDQMTGPGSEMLFVEKFGETLYREAGFTETAEKINGHPLRDMSAHWAGAQSPRRVDVSRSLASMH